MRRFKKFSKLILLWEMIIFVTAKSLFFRLTRESSNKEHSFIVVDALIMPNHSLGRRSRQQTQIRKYIKYERHRNEKQGRSRLTFNYLPRRSTISPESVSAWVSARSLYFFFWMSERSPSCSARRPSSDCDAYSPSKTPETAEAFPRCQCSINYAICLDSRKNEWARGRRPFVQNSIKNN
jgi:hypothetical protein